MCVRKDPKDFCDFGEIIILDHVDALKIMYLNAAPGGNGGTGTTNKPSEDDGTAPNTSQKRKTTRNKPRAAPKKRNTEIANGIGILVVNRILEL